MQPTASRISAITFAAGVVFLTAAKPILAVVPDFALVAAILACFVLSVVSGIFAAIKGRRWAILFPVAASVVLGFVLNPFYWKERLPVTHWAARLHAERGSIDCGHTSNLAHHATVTPEQALECVRSAAASHRAYVVLSTGYGIDASISTAIVGNSDGGAIEFIYQTGMVTPEHRYRLFKHRCNAPIQFQTHDSQVHCVTWPPDKLERDFIVW